MCLYKGGWFCVCIKVRSYVYVRRWMVLCLYHSGWFIVCSKVDDLVYICMKVGGSLFVSW